MDGDPQLFDTESQFHYGSIQIYSCKAAGYHSVSSQFHYGSIQIKMKKIILLVLITSQFHYGSIQITGIF